MATYAVIRALQQAIDLTEQPEVKILLEDVLLQLNPPKTKKPTTLTTKSKLQTKTRLKPRSDKREDQYKDYRPKRTAFLKAHRQCEAKAPGCTGKSQDVHHLQKRNGLRLTDENNWLAVCRSCHTYIGNNTDWAYSNGLLIRVNGLNP